MACFVVTRERGVAWDASRPLTEQDAWDEHAAFMNSLVDDGFVVLGGPLADGTTLLIVSCEREDDIEARLADDPWTAMGLLRVAAIRRWRILIGDEP
jgi:hypothetical protein